MLYGLIDWDTFAGRPVYEPCLIGLYITLFDAKTFISKSNPLISYHIRVSGTQVVLYIVNPREIAILYVFKKDEKW